jgi:hypothetical protein
MRVSSNPIRWRSATAVSIAVAALCSPIHGTTVAAQGAPARSAVLRSGIVLDPVAGVAYVMTPPSGVAALDLTTGARRW